MNIFKWFKSFSQKFLNKLRYYQAYVLAKKFQFIYDNFLWNNHENAGESRSGAGSILKNTAEIRKAIVEITSKYGMTNMLDISCGDWNWMKEIANNLPDYTGLDVVPSAIMENKNNYERENIKFINIDALTFLKKCKNKQFDLILARHTLEHLPLSYNLQLVNEIRRCSKYALINSKNIDTDNITEQVGGYAPINLLLTPYFEILGEPIIKIDDRCMSEASGISYTGLYSFSDY